MELSNLARRVIVAIFGIPLIISCLYFGQYFLLTLALVINFVSQYEFYELIEKKNSNPQKVIGLIAGILIPILLYFRGVSDIWFLFTISTILILLIELFRNKQNALLNTASTIFGLIYPTFFFSFVILIREFPKYADIPYNYGGLWLIVIVITIWICDTAAFFIGKMFGKHSLYKRISPNKTMEGGIAGFVFSIITVYVFYLIFPTILSLFQYLLIGTIVGIFAQIGDLIESCFKRDADVKDSSAILPGHGGFLDRFDAPIFLAPIIYLIIFFMN